MSELLRDVLLNPYEVKAWIRSLDNDEVRSLVDSIEIMLGLARAEAMLRLVPASRRGRGTIYRRKTICSNERS